MKTFQEIRGFTPAKARSIFAKIADHHSGISKRIGWKESLIERGGNNPELVAELQFERLEHGGWANFIQQVAKVVESQTAKRPTLKKAVLRAAKKIAIGHPQRLRAGSK